MSKNEFLNQLEALLYDISKEEREEALTYYREYIEDAGLENEEAIVNELGSVESLAKEIKKGSGSEESYRTFKAPEVRSTANQRRQQASTPKKDNTLTIILAVVLAIVLCPVWLPLLLGCFGIIIGIWAAAFGLLIGITVTGIALLVAAVAILVFAFMNVLSSPLTGFSLLGVALVIAGLGILFCLLIGWFCTTVIPLMMKGISSLFQKIFPSKGKKSNTI